MLHGYVHGSRQKHRNHPRAQGLCREEGRQGHEVLRERGRDFRAFDRLQGTSYR